MQTLDRHRWLWLVVGALLLIASQLRFSVGVLAWIAPVPLLRYLRLTRGWRGGLAVLGTLLAAWTLVLVKIVTAPVPLGLAPGFGLPVGLALALPYLAWSALRSRAGDGLAAPAFAATGVLVEWSLHALLPFGTWGSAANTQLDHLALLQLASVTGVHGVSFLVYWVAAALEAWLDRRDAGRARHALAALLMVAAAIAFGQARLALAGARSEHTARVATIDTDATFAGLPLPEEEELRRIDDALFARTREAARAGARVVVWPEAGTIVARDQEPAFQARVRELARSEGVHVAAAYIVPTSTEPLLYENVYLHVTPEGRVAHRYLKHHPVPGEPAVPGTDPMPIVTDEVLGRVSGALCYDYDFPRLALEQARLDVDLAVLPSSDWRGIDPLHTEMAAVRAIEGGHSVLRSTRFGRSAAIDPYGRVRAWHEHFDTGPSVMLAELPRRGVATIYTYVGDAFVAGSAMFLLLVVIRARRR